MIPKYKLVLALTCINISIVDVQGTKDSKVIIENTNTGEVLNLYIPKNKLEERYKKIEEHALEMNSRCNNEDINLPIKRDIIYNNSSN